MEPYNIIFAAILFWGFAQNMGEIKRNVTTKSIALISKPKSYLQNVPPNISAMIIVLQLIAVFGIGKLPFPFDDSILRITSLVGFALMSKLQYSSAKALGKTYTQEIMIFKNHPIISNGPYKYLRHPQYFGQVAGNIFAAIALSNPFLLIFTLFLELPLYIKRARLEEELLLKHSESTYSGYVTKTIF